jgi:hypothetical protein
MKITLDINCTKTKCGKCKHIKTFYEAMIENRQNYCKLFDIELTSDENPTRCMKCKEREINK